MKRALLAAAALALAACGGPGPAVRTPVVEACAAECRAQCPLTRQLPDGRVVAYAPRWAPLDPEAPGAWDTYPPQVTGPLVAALATCDAQRRACVACLDRLKAAGVTE